MLALKHKFFIKFFLVLVIALGGVIFLAPKQVSAVPITCPDGFRTEGPISERDAICAGHQTGGPANDFAGCYVNNVKVNCPTSGIPNFDAGKCYSATGNSSGFSGYREVPCSASLGQQPQNSSGSGSPDTSSGNRTNVTDIGDCKADPDTGETLNERNCGIVLWLNRFIRALSLLVGIVVTIMIIAGGIQYISAREDPNAVAKAKKQIFNAIIALVLYGLLYAFLDYFIPGGIIQ